MVTYEREEICSGHCEGNHLSYFTPLYSQKKKKKEKKKRQERPKAEGEAMLRFEETWMEWVVVRPPEGCQLPLSLILLQDFAS